ncbi:Hypothetical protein R9X50_00621600 [Acrodontium crateriforme]|uniref:Uncharacterized protein n=1 Tax=Acrodontium crateriforme TaxID=150365 RepID=A0AAQ3M8I0_9PEZI|nr:Hypothetical protein R9X50_00621600 [Acrodontium crateriforme]
MVVYRLDDTVDWEYLEDLWKGNFVEEQNCYRIESTSTRLECCGLLHENGGGAMIKTGCSVRWHIFIPDDLDQTPYITFTSHGIHSHPPPPPSRIPNRYATDIRMLIQRMGSDDLTFTRFLTHGVLEEYLQQQGVQSLSDLHPSLNNTGRIRLEIQRLRLLKYPRGTQLAGVLFQYHAQRTWLPAERYIQGLWNDNNGLMIVCFFESAASAFINQKDFEVDMSFKRIRQANLNEIIFARFLGEHGKVVSFARVIVSTHIAEMYQLAFQRVFQLIEERTRKNVQWQHIHQAGFRAVVVDMLTMQYKGLGMYLSSIDPLHRLWDFHVQSVVFFCRVHVLRSITKAARTGGGTGEMRSLLTATNEDQWMQVMQKLLAHPSVPVRQWALHKNGPNIRAGLQPFFSLMEHERFI